MIKILADDYYGSIDFAQLIGETFIKIDRKDDELVFHTIDGQQISMHHDQDCCESVEIEDICGDLDDLLNTPIVSANESTNEGESHYGESETWTFYRISTNRGGATIRWYGTSNGYYSESVSLELVK
jgi:hypothetical protein